MSKFKLKIIRTDRNTKKLFDNVMKSTWIIVKV